MPRIPRNESFGLANHIIDRAVGEQACFQDYEDHSVFYRLIESWLPLLGVYLYNFSLIPNHFHLLASNPNSPHDFSKGMQNILSSYSKYHRDKYERKGVLWQPRYKSFPVNNDSYMLTLSAYIDLNPFRAGLIGKSYEYQWSSAPHYLTKQHYSILTDNPAIMSLSEDEDGRHLAYRQLLDMWANNTPDKKELKNFFRRQPFTLHPNREISQQHKKCQTL